MSGAILAEFSDVIKAGKPVVDKERRKVNVRYIAISLAP